MCVCAIAKKRFLVDWRLLVKEYIANIGISLDICVFYGDFWRFENILGLLVVANQPTVHNGGVSSGRVCGCGCGVSDR